MIALRSHLRLVVNDDRGSSADIVIDPLSIWKCQANAPMRQTVAQLALGRQNSVEEISATDLRAPTSATIGAQIHALNTRCLENARDGRRAWRSCYA